MRRAVFPRSPAGDPSLMDKKNSANFRTVASAAVALAFLAGCTVGPDYLRPKAAVTPAYKELDGWKVAQPNDDTLRGPWWEIFSDPELNAFEEQVDVSNQNMAVAEAHIARRVHSCNKPERPTFRR